MGPVTAGDKAPGWSLKGDDGTTVKEERRRHLFDDADRSRRPVERAWYHVKAAGHTAKVLAELKK